MIVEGSSKPYSGCLLRPVEVFVRGGSPDVYSSVHPRFDKAGNLRNT